MSEIKPVERFTFSVDHEIAHQDKLGIWVKFSDYEALKAESAAQAKRIEELEISAKRYEKLRRLNAYQFQNIFKTNITSFIRFDELVDNFPASKNGE